VPESELLLVIETPDGIIRSHALTGDELVLGRSTDAGLPIRDPSLSREHARMRRVSEGWVIEDLGSHNGTFVNGRLLEGPASIRPGDLLCLGETRIHVQSSSQTKDREKSSGSQNSIFRSAKEIMDEALRFTPQSGIEDLRRYAEHLRLLNEIHHALGRSIAPAELFDLILERAFQRLKPEEGAVFLREPGGDFACVARRSSLGAGDVVFFSSHLLHEVAEKGQAALVFDTAEDERFAGAESLLSAGVRSLIAAPLLDSGGSLGMIALASRASVRRFNEQDMELLSSLASAAALRVRNVQLTEEAAEKRRLEQEISLARRIQEGLFPMKLPQIAAWETFASNTPSRFVSGDFYTVLERPGSDGLTFLVADVAGKGLAASLLAASLEALCADPIETGLPPHAVLARVSQRLFQRTPPEKYATAFLGSLDAPTGRLTHASGGHLPALIVEKGGRHRWIGSTGVPLGLFEGATYPEKVTDIERGSLLVVYTDGFSEAESPSEEEYGTERILEVCLRCLDRPLSELAAALEADVASFTHGGSPADDRTLFLVRRVG